MRVHEFAKKYGKTSKEIISLCHELGIEVKAAQSAIKDEALVLLNSRFENGKDSDITLFETEVVEKAKPVKKKSTKASKAKKESTPNAVLYAVTECAPFTTVGQLGETAVQFVNEIVKNGDRAIVVLPKYACISEEFTSKMEVIKSTTVKVGWREQLASVYKLVVDNITYYFIENDGYFNRENVYGYDDDAQRFAFFNRAILELLPLIETTLHTIHVNDWHTSLLPLLLTVDYNNHNYYQNIKTTLNIHNLEYQGWYDVTVLPDVLGISTTYYENGLTRMGDSVNFLKSGIETAHEISINDVIREQMTSPEMINCGITAVLQNKLSA